MRSPNCPLSIRSSAHQGHHKADDSNVGRVRVHPFHIAFSPPLSALGDPIKGSTWQRAGAAQKTNVRPLPSPPCCLCPAAATRLGEKTQVELEASSVGIEIAPDFLLLQIRWP